MVVQFLTAASASESMTGLWDVVVGFIIGFLGAVVKVIQYVVTDSWLALLLFAVPLAFLVFGWVKGLIKIKGKG